MAGRLRSATVPPSLLLHLPDVSVSPDIAAAKAAYRTTNVSVVFPNGVSKEAKNCPFAFKSRVASG